MDNKQDRNFYWEVKDFMGKPQEIHKPVKTPNDMVSSIKNILEQNKLYKPSSFNSNINSASTIRQAINAIERNNQKGTPENIQHTKNITSNPFGVIREGIFDDLDKPSKPNIYNDGIIRGPGGGNKVLPNSNDKLLYGLAGVQQDFRDRQKSAEFTAELIRNSEPPSLSKGVNVNKVNTKDITDYSFNTPYAVIPKDDPRSPLYKYRERPQTAANPNSNPNAQSTQLPDGTWVDDNGNPVPGAPTPEDRSADDRENNRGKAPMVPTKVGVMQKTTPTPDTTETGDALGNLRDARGTFVPTRTYRGADRASNQSEVQNARKARNDSIRSATIAANSSRDDLKAKWNAARAADPSSAETIALQKQLRSMNDEINPASPQQGNIRQSDVALRYAKSGQRNTNTQSQEETTRIANEFVASQNALKANNSQPAPEDRSADERENNRGKAPMTPAPEDRSADERENNRGKAPMTPTKVNTPSDSSQNTASGMPSKNPVPPSSNGSGLGTGFLNSPTEEMAPNIFPNMTLNGKEVNKKAKDLSTLLQA
jgi:hypothetical protein